MKKFLALAALVLGMVSCQQDYAGLDVDANGEAAVTVSVAIPEMETRAGGTNSAVGAFGNIDLTKYDVRYILEVYDHNGALAKERLTNYEDKGQTTAFNLRLIPGRAYRFVVWADFVLEGKKEDLHYNTADLKNIQLVTTEWALSDESRDAYTGIKDVDNFSNSAPISIELKRPLGKLRVVTTDVKDMFNVLPEDIKVVYFSKIYTSFNAHASSVKDKETVAHVKEIKISDSEYKNEWVEVNSESKVKGDLTLFTDYYFAAEQQEPINFTLEVKDDKGGEIPKVVFNTPIPIQRNYLTTVTGPILTDSGNITVEIKDAFENGPDWNPEDDKFDVELISGIKTETLVLEAGNYLFDDVTIKAAGNAIEVNGDVVIDVMGVMTLDSEGGIVVKNGSLVINGVVETRGAERAGILKVETKEGSAIGGNNITIQNLAGLTAKANGDHAFGIGAAGATVVIKNTKIDYVCGGHIQPVFVNDTKYGKSEPEGGAAIGGANVTIENSEIVKAEGGSKAAAIGNKFWADTNIVIKNSTLGDIFGGNASAAIGGSRYNGESKHNISIEIEDSTITNAVGGQAGAGIGSGYDTHCNQENYEATNNIVIKNSTIKAKGGKNAAGIGTGYHSAYLTGSIDAASTVEATHGDEPFYKSTYTLSQNIGYGIVDPAREFSGANAEVTFTVAGKVIATPSFRVTSADDFNKVMALGYEYINVELGGDITVAGGTSKEYGGADTKMIVIDGNGKTLTYTDSYRTYVKMANADGKIVFKNMNLYRETTGGTHWHDNNMKFCCNAEFNNVKFNKGICFDNTKTFVVNDATITKGKVATYGLFITAGCDVTIDGLTIDHAEGVAGRGIKIVDEDVKNPTLTTLTITNSTFKTAAKAAILVGSSAGADITVSNLNIAEVVEDSSNEVWVDEDYAAYVNKVNVVGGSMIVEGQSIVSITNMETLKSELAKAGEAGAGYTVLEITADINMTGQEWTPIKVDGYNGADIVTIDGKGHTITGLNASLFAGGFAGGSGIVIKNLTIADSQMVATNTQGYGAFVNCADSMDVITLINCHLKNSSIITPNDGTAESRIGGLVGWTAGYGNQNDGPVDSYITIENCSVTGCTLKGAGSIGAICGHAGANKATFTTIKNCIIEDNKLISTDNGSWRTGVVVGTANNGQCNISNITESGNTLTQTSASDFQNPTGDKRHYYGRFVPAGTGSLEIDGIKVL
ncbi:MAG: hypothetical protein IIV55_05050 [Alistipes sp.]|nr:hypothetical protein [Alistipes sp.]